MIYQSCSEHLSKHISPVLHSDVPFTISLVLFLPPCTRFKKFGDEKWREGGSELLSTSHLLDPPWVPTDPCRKQEQLCVLPGARFQAGAVGVEEVGGILHARKVLFLLFDLPFFAPSVHLQTPEGAKVAQPYPL